MSAVPEPDLRRSMRREMSSAILREREKNILICERMKVVVQSRRRVQEMKAAAVTAQLLRCRGLKSLVKICHLKEEMTACVAL